MASVSRINGFRPVKTVTGAPYTGQANLYFVPASDASVIMVGDLVKPGGDARSPTGVATVTRAAVGDAVIGVVTGIIYTGVGDVANVPPVQGVLDSPVFRATLTNRYVLVADDPNLVFEVQTSGATLATADIGLNANATATAGSTANGASGETVDLSTKAVTATLTLKLFGFPYRPDNNIGDAFTSAYVIINNHLYKGGTGSLGIA